ncbi:MAG: twin-arginine translocase subunit TatC [Victivallaceae bacterium]
MDESGESSFFTHLEALRQMLIRSFAAIGILLIPGYLAAGKLMPVLIRYLAGEGDEAIKFHYFTPLEPFLVQIKLGLLLSLFVALPYVSMQISRFAAPGLYTREKKVIRLVTGAVFILFLIGAAFAFFLVLPLLLNFARSYRSDDLMPILGLSNFIGLAGLMLLGFGVIFQLPVVVLMLIKLGIVRVATLRKQRPVIVVIILIVAAILTPPDVISQLLMAAPAWILFELSLLIGIRIEPPEPEPGPEVAPESGDDGEKETPVLPDDPDADPGYSPYAKALRPKRRKVRPFARR